MRPLNEECSVAVCAILLAVSSGLAPAAAPEFPARPLRIVTGSAGGGTDLVARIIGEGLSSAFAQAVIIDNRASGVVQGEAVARAAPDGHTLLVSSGNLWISGFMQDVPYDAVRDFRPITQAATSPYVVVVHPQVAAKSVKELIALAKARPGELNYLSLAVGSSNHLAAELFKALAGVDFTRVAYKSAQAGTVDLLSGQVHVGFLSVTAVAPHVKTGRMRALAVTGPQPSALFPGLPTVSASVKGYETAAVYGLFAPARTPNSVIARVHQAVAAHLKSQTVRDRLFTAGVETVVDTPDEFAGMLKMDMARWSKVIKDAGIRAE